MFSNLTYKLKQSDLKFNFLIFRRVSIQEGALRTSESDSPRETVPESRFIIRIRHVQAPATDGSYESCSAGYSMNQYGLRLGGHLPSSHPSCSYQSQAVQQNDTVYMCKYTAGKAFLFPAGHDAFLSIRGDASLYGFPKTS